LGLTLRKLRLRAVWLLVLPFFFLARPTPRLLLLGGAIAALGTTIRAWAAGTIHKERTLTTSGPYAHTRNPLYLGSFLIGTGATIAGGRWEFTVLFLAFFVVVYGRTMRAEAELLGERFGDRHAEYARNVPFFVPRPIPWRAPVAVGALAEEGFTLRQWRRNREYQALLGVAAAFAVLAAKMWWG
jgi:protein-S-isoprenylcysteine O-methyltransferase Ste14